MSGGNRERRTSFALIAIVAFSIAIPAAAQATLPPLFTTYRHSDHHWFAWLPTHPTYEAIEATITARPPQSPLVVVWLSERASPKHQVHYINDKELAKLRWGGEPYYREIESATAGEAGHPLGVRIRFSDKNNQPVEWTMSFPAAAQLVPAGLTTPSGESHNSAYFFHLFYRRLQAPTDDSHTTIGGNDYSFPPDPAIAKNFKFRAGYSKDIDTVIIRYGTFDAAPRDDVSFDGMRYVHKFGAHQFTIVFEPALPDARTVKEAVVVHYVMSVDSSTITSSGTATVSPLKIAWRPDSPEWTRNVRFTTTYRAKDGGGYEFQTQRDLIDSAP